MQGQVVPVHRLPDFGNVLHKVAHEEYEQPEWHIPESILENPKIRHRTELFLPIDSDDGKPGGKLYLKDWCDDLWGYEITALVAYMGEKPACWY